MSIDFSRHEDAHLLAQSATHPMEPPWGVLGALLLLAGTGPLLRRAFPSHPMTTRSGASNCRF